MGWAAFLPLLLPLGAIGAIVFVLAIERPRRKSRVPAPPVAVARVGALGAVPGPAPELPEDDAARATARLEAAAGSTGAPDYPALDTWLRTVAGRGTEAHLARLAAVPPTLLAPLGNAPAHLAHAATRAETQETRAALKHLRDAVLARKAESRLDLWKAMLAEPPETIALSDDRFEALSGQDIPGIMQRVWADLAERADDPDWRALRLNFIGWVSDQGPDHPPAREVLDWIVAGLSSETPAEREAAIGALAAHSESHLFAPTAAEGAALRDRIIALALSPLAEAPDMATDLGDILHQLGGLTHVDAAPIETAATALIEAAAEADPPEDVEAAATGLLRRGAALLRAEPFAAAAMERHPDHPVIAAAALRMIEENRSRYRIASVPTARAEAILGALLAHAPAVVVGRLADRLEETLDILPDWSRRPGTAAALEAAAGRGRLPGPLRARLAALAARAAGQTGP